MFNIEIEELKKLILASSSLFDVTEQLLSRSENSPTRTTTATHQFRSPLEPRNLFRSAAYIENLTSYLATLHNFPLRVIRAAANSSDWKASLEHFEANQSRIGKWFRSTFMNGNSSSTSIILHPELRQELEDSLDPPNRTNKSRKSAGKSVVGSRAVCECCYDNMYLTEAIQCDSRRHSFCAECIENQVKELVHGGARLVEEGLGVVCFSIDGTKCGVFSSFALESALSQELFDSLKNRGTERLAEALLVSGVAIQRCPFCPYFEIIVEENYFLELLFSTFPFSLFKVFLLSLLYLLLLPVAFYEPQLFKQNSRIPEETLFPILEPNRVFVLLQNYLASKCRTSGESFRCKNGPEGKSLLPFGSNLDLELVQDYTSLVKLVWSKEKCGRVSCTTCFKDLSQFEFGHRCLSESDELKNLIELEISKAVIRYCPGCNVAIVKNEGCNRIACRCGTLICCERFPLSFLSLSSLSSRSRLVLNTDRFISLA